MNFKKVSSVTLATLIISTGFSGLNVFADSPVNSDTTNTTYVSTNNISQNDNQNFSEKVIIDNQDYIFNHKFSGDLHIIDIQGENESETVTINLKSNEVYLNDKYMNTAEVNTPSDDNLKTTLFAASRSTWTYKGSHKFRYSFAGSESKAAIAAVIASFCSLPASSVMAAASVIYGTRGFCSFKETIYFKRNNQRARKHVLSVYSDRNWSSYETSVTHYNFI